MFPDRVIDHDSIDPGTNCSLQTCDGQLVFLF
jgi:hypothetical protein